MLHEQRPRAALQKGATPWHGMALSAQSEAADHASTSHGWLSAPVIYTVSALVRTHAELHAYLVRSMRSMPFAGGGLGR